MGQLTQDELATFERDGYLGPFKHPLLDEGVGLAQRTLDAWRRNIPRLAHPGFPVHEVLPQRLESGMAWFKSAHLLIPELWEIALHPAIADRVASILGPDVMWWGAVVQTKNPGDIHGWHYDTEYDIHEGVVVFIGLDGMNQESSLKCVTGTHKLNKAPVAYTGGVYGRLEGNGILSDAKAIGELAKTIDPSFRLVEPDMTTGDFFLAHGKLWHGSHNTSQRARTAAVFHFCRPDADVRIPLSYDENPLWYGKRPPCAMLLGEARGEVLNPIVERPRAE